MDKIDFINTILEMYPSSFTENNTQMWIDLYTRKLPSNIDFQQLFDDLLVSYQNTNVAPSTAFLMNLAVKQRERLKLQQKEKEAVLKAEQWKKEREEIEKEDRPITCKILKPLEVLAKSYGDVERENKNFFTDVEMKTLRQYVKDVIPTEKLRIDFWQQVCRLIQGGNLSELCRNMQKFC